MHSVRIAECRLRLAQDPKRHEAPWIRDFFGRPFEDELLRPSRDRHGEQAHQYPRIQFKLVESAAVLLGIGEGAEYLERAWSNFDPSSVENATADVHDAYFETREEELSARTDPVTYRFLTPWLGLNDKNFRSYTGSRSTAFRKEELSRILVGNCLGMAKSLGIRLEGQIDADGRKLTSIKTSQRGDPVIGFIGTFQVNLQLPELIGLGRSVGRGFGTVVAESA